MKTVIIIISFLIAFSNAYSQGSLELVATITGEKDGDEFSMVHGVGDVNGDGFNDVLVMARSGDYAKLYFGGAPFDTIADFRFTGYGFGAAGDVNGDGYSDIVIINYYPYYADVKMYFGGAEFDTIPDIVNWKQYFDLNSSLTGVGDVNNDGFDDFIISNSNSGTTCIGCSYHGSYLFLGGDNVKTSPYLTFNTSKAEDDFGQSICGCDVNNDGFNDIVIGAPAGRTETDTGKVYIYYGGATMDTNADSILYRDDCTGYAMFGMDISNAGDINGDGKDDIIIVGSGSVFLYLSNNNCIVMQGSSIGSGGDINNDGINDFLIGNTDYINNAGVMVGQARGYFGSTSLDTLYDFNMEGENKWERFSYFLTIAGDLNGDGYDEVIVGAPGFPDYQNPLGKVDIYSYVNWDNVEEKKDTNPPKKFKLNQNFPNPFNSQTNIDYHLPFFCQLKIIILNTKGQFIKTLFYGKKNVGSYQITWDGTDEENRAVPSGLYLCRIEAVGRCKTIKLLMTK